MPQSGWWGNLCTNPDFSLIVCRNFLNLIKMREIFIYKKISFLLLTKIAPVFQGKGLGEWVRILSQPMIAPKTFLDSRILKAEGE